MKKALLICLSFIAFFSCSENETVPQKTFPDMILLSKRDNGLYQTNVTDNGNNFEDINLTSNYNVPQHYNMLEKISNNFTITWLGQGDGNVYFFQKNIETDSPPINDKVCDINFELHGIRAFQLNSENHFILFTAKFTNGTTKNFIKLYNKITKSCQTIFLSNLIYPRDNISATVHENYLIVSQRINTETTTISKININSGITEKEISIPNSRFSGTIANNTIYIFVNDKMNTYDFSNLQLLNSEEFNNYLIPGPRWFKSQVKDNKMLISLPYPAPADVSNEPALIDLNTGNLVEIKKGFLLDIHMNKLKDLFSYTAFVGRYFTDLKSKRIYCCFSKNYEFTQGGVLEINFDGEITNYIETEFFPHEIIFKNQ
ncbi:hypothetical protein SAMN04489761_3710 [Tenacibaculum sp. MAR_2009_124]|uniref:hypothetical protein n=1 Tax=Tenacibaculum sp. MAR_2009_124 TaxID=1250059 RepID=UPI00089D5F9B|nr:hypothetical protein [Tenacibaculum sp. MAR_2009_124]SEC83139.1 hypothetical protein SAMN04489761_3710 [Tenacibaculum sp. MAR_2009_124]